MGGINKYYIFNKDSRLLSEVEDDSVDVVFTSPPFNISHKYKYYHDSLDYKGVMDLYSVVVKSISRVLRKDGYFIIDIADMIVMEDVIMYGAEFIKELSFSNNLDFICSYPYIAIEGSDIEMDSIIPRGDNRQKFHSSCEQILFFGKKSSSRDFANKISIKPFYTFSKEPDSAFWPLELIKDVLSPFYLKNKVILDPFMGSGSLGRLAIERGGSFIGYDVDRETLRCNNWL